MRHTDSFLATLADISFTEFLTTKLLKFIYVAAIGVCALWSIWILVIAARLSSITGILALFFVPIAFLIGVTLSRVWCELIIVVFRIADHTADTAEQAATIALNTAQSTNMSHHPLTGAAD